MHWINREHQVKVLLMLSAAIICVVSLLVSHYLVYDLKVEEQRKVEVWAEAMQALNQADENTDLSLVLKVLGENHTIPIVVLDSEGAVQDVRNMSDRLDDDMMRRDAILRRAKKMQEEGRAIRITLSPTDHILICYDESLLLRRLALWPYMQLGMVLIFVVVAIFALLSSKKAEQNKVWVGLSKETAHQLGTPISSLMAWKEALSEQYPGDELIEEMGKDILRLQRIAERFSKIGSMPAPQRECLNDVVSGVVQYIARRAGNHVKISCQMPDTPVMINMIAPLFEWVIENLCKNAIDAMEGKGSISISAYVEEDKALIDVTDTGKGIPKNRFRTVFTPGYTTKRRGWGLGLSLAKRIVEEYHQGRIYVLQSTLGKGTTFRIELKHNLPS